MGDSLHCPKCEYEFRFDHPENAPVRCPECGTGWLGLLKKGRRVRSGRLMATGLAIALLGGLVTQPIFYMGWLAPHLPTPLLFGSLYAFPKTWYTAWDELARRPLDAWSTRVMAERVLRQRRTDQYDGSPSKWFEAAAAAGKVPPELAERFYREGMEAELVVPRRVKAGEEFTAAVRVRRLSSGSNLQVGVFFAGYQIGDEPGLIGRESKTLWGYQLRPDVLRGSREVMAGKLKAARAGQVRVRATYWIVFLPSFMEELVWQADGTPARPAKASWFQRIELEKMVKVE